MSAARREWRSEAGVTLIELMVVLAVIAFAAALVLPRVSGSRERLTLEATAVQLSSGLKRARAATLRTNQEHALILDLVERRFWADGAVGAQRLSKAITISAEPVQDSGQAVFRFRPDGSASGGRITLESRGKSAVISVDWLTGATNVHWRK